MEKEVDFIHDIPLSEFNRLVKPSNYVLAVIGSRKYNNKDYIYKTIDTLLNALLYYKQISNLTDVIIISGKAYGVDSIARSYGLERGMLVINILPDWDTFKKGAGFKRNANIIRHANRVLAFRLNNSNGTSDGLEHANKLKIPSHVHDV